MLDIGGGSGSVSAWLAEHAGMEPTISEVRPRSSGDLPSVLQVDPLTLPVESRSFGSALLLYVLHHLPDLEQQDELLREAARVAGRVLVIEDCPENAVEGLTARALDWGFNRPLGVPTPFTFRAIGKWRLAFAEAGFSMVHVERFRAWWPALGLFPSAMFVLDAPAPPASRRL